MNEQMDFVIPASKIFSLQADTLVEQVALDFGQEDNFPTAMYHCITNLDLKKLRKKKPIKNCQKYITLGQQIIERNYCKRTLREYTTK